MKLKRLILAAYFVAFALVVGWGVKTSLADVIINGAAAGGSASPQAVATAGPVLAANARRINWTIEPETVSLRCTAGTYSKTAGSFTAPTAPTTSQGFLVPAGQLITEKSLVAGANVSGSYWNTDDFAKVEIDCISTGASTLVDTWQETLPTSQP